jgi:hypothetical protein
MTNGEEARQLAAEKSIDELSKMVVERAETVREAKQSHSRARNAATDAQNAEARAVAALEVAKSALLGKLERL